VTTLPRYPVYIPSVGRHDASMSLTANCLVRDGVPFYLVVHADEADAYAARFGAARVLVLPFPKCGYAVPARNWIKAHSLAAGDARHWQLDDNMTRFRRRYRGKRIPVAAGIALRATEDFTDRYSNVALSAIQYTMFVIAKMPPVYINAHIYSCTLVNNAIPHAWRGRYNDDTDLTLQVLAGGWCTLVVNAFMVDKMRTLTMKGGMNSVYLGDGRLKMARSLERVWPGVVTTIRRFKRPQHWVAHQWQHFDTPLQYRSDFDPRTLPAVDELGMTLRAVRPIQSPRLRALVADRVEPERALQEDAGAE
jgi:hypothetical protein